MVFYDNCSFWRYLFSTGWFLNLTKCQKNAIVFSHCNRTAAADPGLVIGGAPTPWGRRPNIVVHFLKNPMKLKKFWSVRGCAPGAPPS